MPLPSLRPRFELQVKLPSEAVFDRLEALVDADDHACTGNIHSDHVDLGIPAADQHFWSPFLKLVVTSSDDVTRLEGRFGPNSNVWTMFLAIYAFCGFTIFGAVIIGFSQWSIDQTPGAFYVAGAAALLALVAYGIALVGQTLAAEQMDHLRELVRQTFDDAIVS